ncbi:MAG: TIGR03620 family F420-dependent LLM class oxidoreductase [Candidatus Eremiobacteraeota bacterium]|nr:TIGR03620 family F420-dependent LLM class oxidoreductase [Candidatus Eremiobacteraeota bacterium]MCW5866416.1 TIGR03620 family F420-dependent LLM class oxidoreductase [Candidatus Eremiobacteraeota bacterium]
MDIKNLGVWAFTDQYTATQAADFARRVEDWGYGALWYPEAVGRDSLVQAGWLLSHTKNLVVASGIANIFARDAQSSLAGANALNELSGGRFLLGLGVSHAPLVEAMRGHKYEKPLAHMRDYLEAMKKAAYQAPPPPERSRVVLAALAPGMLKLSSELADGAHPYNVNPDHTRQARAILGPDKWLCVEHKVVLEGDATKARAAGRACLDMYTRLPNYVNNWKKLGFSEAEITGQSDRFIDEFVAWGDESAIAEKVRQHWEAGANHVCLQALQLDGKTIDEKALERLAERLI